MEDIILGIETSCDETSAAVVRGGRRVLSNVVSSQVELHERYGGVVPELASRRHIENIRQVIETALKNARITLNDVEAVAVTVGPGLIGALLVGLAVAKSLCYALNKPLIRVNHLAGHIFSIFLEQEPEFPFIALVASGGHTDLYLIRGFETIETLGRTRDDAAGECFDKGARIMGLGYPGGPRINALADEGDPTKISFPRPMFSDPSLDFSFSGLKTSLKIWAASHPKDEWDSEGITLNDAAASFQEAVVDVLVKKTLAAAERSKVATVTVSGGVAANTRLKERLKMEGATKGIKLFMPGNALCTDNAAMIAAAGYFSGGRARVTGADLFSVDASPNLNI